MKIKKLFCLLAAGVVAVSAFAGSTSAYFYQGSYDEYVNARKAKIGNFTYIIKDYAQYGSVYISNVATVIDIPNTQKVEIPEKVAYNGIEFTVTDLSLSEEPPSPVYKNVKEIVLPETIYNISHLYGFKSLNKMNLPKNAMIDREKDIQNGNLVYTNNDFNDTAHFYYLGDCPNLKLSVDPNNPYYNYNNDLLLSKDGKKVYMCFNQSTSLIIPDGVEEILDYGGIGFNHVQYVQLPDTLKNLSGTWKSLEDVRLPNKLKSLSGFYGNKKITNIILPDSLETIWGYTFSKTKLTSIIIPDNVKNLYTHAFAGSSLKYVRFGKSLTEIGQCAFQNCKKLKTVTIPENIIHIDERAFSNCKMLSKVNINSNNVNIHFDAFSNCKKLKSVTINGAERIDARAFESCNNLTNIKINNSKISLTIEEEAFYNCKKLKSVTISGVKKIYANAFYNCKKLSKITIKNKKKAPKVLSGIKGSFKNTKKGIKFVVKNKKVAKQLKKQLSKKKFKNNLKNAKILIGKKVVYKI